MDVVMFIGSDSDFEVVKDGLETLKNYGLDCTLEITSAHRSPERTLKLIREYEDKGVGVFIAVAGKAAHLAGFVAAHTIRPVIGVPVESGGLVEHAGTISELSGGVFDVTIGPLVVLWRCGSRKGRSRRTRNWRRSARS